MSETPGSNDTNLAISLNQSPKSSVTVQNNVAIYEGTSTFVKGFITTASKQLLNTDQLLMKSQVTMQSVLCSLKDSKMNIKQLHEKKQ
ncbi:biogenesis of lysosome-related organelles complex 1 subunit 3-like [Rhagoletis pomonella]|uniref:biogenesis of lysosome-related organelles complex 1 subunit 3-like n=1 Tax=Rhagoletis pomonella TaxID=28610 RepID=UPI0017870268|nr:biogenesis of lysosome-related organelles complex 1 subunit 3-like [Rhagoletis pomonella]